MSEHSPGPWSIGPQYNGMPYRRIHSSDGRRVAAVYSRYRDENGLQHVPQMANANRIVDCCNLLDGVSKDDFPVIEDWLKENRFKPMAGPEPEEGVCEECGGSGEANGHYFSEDGMGPCDSCSPRFDDDYS